jgi:hypothetical protein
MKEILRRQNSRPFLTKFLLFRYNVSADNCQRALVDESETIRNQTGNAQQISNGPSAWYTCAIPPCNTNSSPSIHCYLGMLSQLPRHVATKSKTRRGISSGLSYGPILAVCWGKGRKIAVFWPLAEILTPHFQHNADECSPRNRNVSSTRVFAA